MPFLKAAQDTFTLVWKHAAYGIKIIFDDENTYLLQQIQHNEDLDLKHQSAARNMLLIPHLQVRISSEK